MYARATKTRGTGTVFSYSYLPGTSVNSARPCHNIRTFCNFCKTFIPVPGTSGTSVRLSYPYPKFCEFCMTRATIRGVRVQHVSYPPRTSVSYVRPLYNTRNFCDFCNTSIPVPKTSGSSVRLSHPHPESTNPTEHNLAKFCKIKIPKKKIHSQSQDNLKLTNT